MINQFKGIYVFLSNFFYFSNGIWYDNIYYPTVEHFFQAMKTLVREERIAISEAMTPAIAKWMASPNGYKGFKIVLRPDWEDIKIPVMAFGLRVKFSAPLMQKMLIDTYPHNLVEGNYWNDKFWGFCLKTNKGENNLGKLHMVARERLINGLPLDAPDLVF